MSSSRSVQSSGSESTIRWKVSASPIEANTSVAILEAMAGAATGALGEEYQLLLEDCGLLGRSERGKLARTGAEAIEFLNGQVTNELAALAPGQGCYAAFLTHKGKMLGDLRVLAVDAPGGGGTELLLDTERPALQELFDIIRRFKVGFVAELPKPTVGLGLLPLRGPRTAVVAGHDSL